MPAAYAISHFVVSPSVRPEAFGRIAIESQASGRIIIATKIGGSLGTVIEGETGFFVEPYDVDGFAAAIDKVLAMPKEEIDKMGLAARKNIESNFSLEKFCAETIHVYRSVVSWAAKI